MPISRLQEFLREHGTTAETIPHSQAFTAQEVAEAAHIPGKEMAKTVIVLLGETLAMVVLRATDQLSMERLRQVTGARDARLASEEEFADVFPSCEVGAMPPFGNLWDLTVFVDERLREDEHIAFRAGTHTEVMRLPYSEFERLVGPVVGKLSTGS